jgi:hypothetical protein
MEFVGRIIESLALGMEPFEAIDTGDGGSGSVGEAAAADASPRAASELRVTTIELDRLLTLHQLIL